MGELKPIPHGNVRQIKTARELIKIVRAFNWDQGFTDKVALHQPVASIADAELREQLHLDGIIVEPNPGGKIPLDDMMTSLRILADHGITTLENLRTLDYGCGGIAPMRLQTHCGADAVSVDIDPLFPLYYNQPGDQGEIKTGDTTGNGTDSITTLASDPTVNTAFGITDTTNQTILFYLCNLDMTDPPPPPPPSFAPSPVVVKAPPIASRGVVLRPPVVIPKFFTEEEYVWWKRQQYPLEETGLAARALQRGLQARAIALAEGEEAAARWLKQQAEADKKEG